jgi:hypothetical protein
MGHCLGKRGFELLSLDQPRADIVQMPLRQITHRRAGTPTGRGKR